MHQMDVLYLPWDKFKRKTYKYALTVVDVASRYKEAEPLTSKIASQVADAIKKIYGRSPLTWPALARVDAGTEFKGEFKQLFRAKNVELIEGVPGVHRSQGIVKAGELEGGTARRATDPVWSVDAYQIEDSV